MSAQPEQSSSRVEIPATQYVPPSTWVSAEEAARRTIARRINFLTVFEQLSKPDGLVGWRIVGEEPDPEPLTDEDIE